MNFPIQIIQTNGSFSATTVLGNATFQAMAPTRELVLETLRKDITRRIELGEIVSMNIPVQPEVDFIGMLSDDPTLDELRDEIYRQRDAERPS